MYKIKVHNMAKGCTMINIKETRENVFEQMKGIMVHLTFVSHTFICFEKRQFLLAGAKK